MVQGSLDPKMMDALQGDTNAANWEEQLKALNMTPEEVIQKIMSDPELAGVRLHRLMDCLLSQQP